MQIGLYHESAGTRHAGGVVTYLQHVAVELAETNDVSLYTGAGDVTDLLERSSVTVVEVPTTSSTLDLVRRVTPLAEQDVDKLAMALRLRRSGLLEEIERTVDVLLTFQCLDDLFLSNITDVPTVYGVQSFHSVGIGAKLRERFSRTEHVFVNTPDTASRIADEFGYEPETVVYPGVDTEAFHPDAEPALESDEPLVLFVGRLVESKGVYDLLEAFASMETDARLCLVGRGDVDGVRARCRELGIGDAVDLAGEVPHLELPGYYAAADVFCLPTRAESFGMVNVEAMACGTAVVTTDLEAIRAYATHGEDALLASPADPDDLADKLAELVASTDRRRALGERARRRALQFQWDEQVRRLERFCETVVGDGADRTDEPRSATGVASRTG